MPIGGLLGAWMDLQNQRAQAQVSVHQGLLNQPGLTNEQRQSIMGQMQGMADKAGIFSPYHGLKFPTQQVMGPGNVNAPPGGVGADVSGMTIQAPPSGGAFGALGVTPPAPTPGTAGPDTGFVPPGAPVAPSAPPSPASATSALGTTMPGATFQGQPQASTQFVMPPQDMAQVPISSLPSDQDAILQNLDPGTRAMVQGMTLAEASQMFPMIGMMLQFGAFGGGGTQGAQEGLQRPKEGAQQVGWGFSPARGVRPLLGAPRHLLGGWPDCSFGRERPGDHSSHSSTEPLWRTNRSRCNSGTRTRDVQLECRAECRGSGYRNSVPTEWESSDGGHRATTEQTARVNALASRIQTISRVPRPREIRGGGRPQLHDAVASARKLIVTYQQAHPDDDVSGILPAPCEPEHALHNRRTQDVN